MITFAYFSILTDDFELDGRNPEAAQRPLFRELLLTLLNIPKAILSIPQEALDTHSLAGVLGSTLKAGENMYRDLQDRYTVEDDDHDYQEVH